MDSITYIATDSLLPSRSAGENVTFEIDITDSRRSRKVEKDVQRSLGGAIEVLKHSSDVTWNLTFEPVRGYRLLQLREFLDSTEGGEEFSIQMDGSAESLRVKRVDDGYDEDPFLRTGRQSQDYFQASIRVLVI